VVPLGDVASFPNSPTATKRPSSGDHATPQMLVPSKLEVCCVQLIPSTEVASWPALPTATSKGFCPLTRQSPATALVESSSHKTILASGRIAAVGESTTTIVS